MNVKNIFNWDCGKETNFWFIIKDRYCRDEYCKKTKKYLAKANERFNYTLISKELLKEQGLTRLFAIMFLKYIFDRVTAFVGLAVLWPVLLVVAILIKIKMPGGLVIFRQKRVGRNGKLFTMYKFRSMTVNHEGSSVSVAGESRITPLGAKLRHYKLDELPELWNVLIGDMSFVGPRPDVPGYADQLQGADREVLKLRPGITGPASLKYRDEEVLLAAQSDPQRYNDEVIFPDKVRINRYYLHHYSFVKDIRMIVCTILGRCMKYGNEVI